MNRPSTRSARVIAAAGVVSAVSMLGLGTAASASAAVASPTASVASSRLASVNLQASLNKVVWQPPYGCIVCGLGGFDPGTFGGPVINPATLGTIGF